MKSYLEGHTSSSLSKRAAEVVEHAQDFFSIRDAFLSLFDIDTFGSIENISSMDIICRGYPPIYDPNFRQRGLNGDVVSSLKQLYECATTVKPTFENALRRIAASLSLETREQNTSPAGLNWTGLVLCPLKALDKASEKVQRKYRLLDPGPPEAWLYDVVRASFVCDSEAQICAVCDAIQAFPSFEVVRIKNRFTSPLVNGYRDIQLIVRLIVKNQLGHLVTFICEVCVTHSSQAHYEDTHPKAKEVSEYFSPLLTGSTEKKEALCSLLEECMQAVQKERKAHSAANISLVDLVYRLAAPYYEQGNVSGSREHYFDEDLDFVLENWVDLLKFLHLYEEAEKFQVVVLKIVIQIAGGEEENPDVAEALDTHAMLLKLQGKYSQAIASYEKSIFLKSRVFGESHPAVASTLLLLADVMLEQRKFSSAKPYHEQALVIRRHAFGEYHPEVASSLTKLGALCEAQRQLDKAVDYYEKAIAVWKAIYSTDHPIVAETLSHLGNVHDQLTDYKSALACFETALSLQVANYGEGSAQTDKYINSVAFALKKLGDYDLARPQFERLLELRLALHGESHASVATASNNLGLLLKKQKLYAEAKECYTRALAIRRKIYAHLHGEHEDVASSLNNLALLYESMDNIPAALEHHEQALRIRRSVFGEEHLLVAETLNNIGLTYKKANDLVKAKFHFEEALQIRLLYGSDTPNVKTTQSLIASVTNISHTSSRLSTGVNELFVGSKGGIDSGIDGKRVHLKVYGQEQLSLALSLRSLALSLVQGGRAEEAAPLLEQSLHLIKLVHDDKSPVLTTSLPSNIGGGSSVKADTKTDNSVTVAKHEEIALASIYLARVLQLQCKYEVAAGLLLTANAILSVVYSNKDSRVVENLLELARVYYAQEYYDKAKQVLEDCLSLTKQIYGEENEAVASVLSELAKVIKGQGEYTTAKKLYEKSLGSRIKLVGDDHPLVALSLSEIGMLMQAMKQYVDAMALHKQALAIRVDAFKTEMHTDVGVSYRSIAAVHIERGRWPDAKDALEKAAHILRSTEGEDGILLGGALKELAIVTIYCQVCHHSSFATTIVSDPGVAYSMQGTAKSDITVLNMSRLLKQQTLPLRALDLDVAVPLLEKALDIYTKCFGDLHPDTAFIYSELGLVLRHFPTENTNERALAVLFLQQAYSIRQRLFNDVKHHPLVLQTLHDLNDFLLEEGLWERAVVTTRDLHMHLIDMHSSSGTESKGESIFEPGDSAEISQCLLQTALVHLRLNELHTARDICTKCFEMCVRVFGPDSVETSCALTLLGEIRHSQGKPNKAKTAHEGALAIRKKLYEKDIASRGRKSSVEKKIEVVDTTSCSGDFSILYGCRVSVYTLLAETYESLAALRLQSTKMEKTREMYSMALTIRREQAKDQPDVMMSHLLSDTAHVLCLQERYLEAKSIALETLRIRRVVCRFDKSLVSDALVQLASVCLSLHEIEEALLFLEEALSIRKEVFSSNSVPVADIYQHMAMVFSEAGESTQAVNYLNMSLQVHKRRARMSKVSNSTRKKSPLSNFDDSDDIAKTLVELGMLFFKKEDYRASLPYFEEAISMYLRLGGLDNPHLPPVLLKLAFSFKKLGDLTASRQRYEQAIAILTNLHKKVNGVHLDVAAAVSSLSSLCFYEGKFLEALEFSKKVLVIRKSILGAYHEDVMNTLWNQATICEKLGRYKESLGKVLIVYKWRRRRLGFDSLKSQDSSDSVEGDPKEVDGDDKSYDDDTISIDILQAQYQCLVLTAVLYRKAGDLSESLKYNQSAISLLLRIKQRDNKANAECDDYDILERYAFTADIYKQQTLYEKAEKVLRDVVKRCMRTHGSQDIECAHHMYTLATILNKRGGKFAEAYDSFNSALATQRALLGPEDLTVANTLNNIGVLLVSQDKYKEAEDVLQQALAIREKHLGDYHEDVAASLNNIAGLHDMRSEYTEAREMYEKALEIRVKLLPKNHPAVAQTMNNLAQLQLSAGAYEKAEKLFRNTLRMLQAFHGKNHPDVAACMNNLAGSLENSSDPKRQEEALALFQDAFRIRESVFGKVHASTAQSLNNTASLYYRMGKLEDAIKLYKESIEIKTALYGSESTDIAESRNNIAMLHMAAGALVSAVHCQEEAVELMDKLLGPENPRTVNVKGNLGIIYRRMGTVAKGDAMVAAAMRYFHSKDYSDTHPWVKKFAAEGVDFLSLEEDIEEDTGPQTRPRKTSMKRKPVHLDTQSSGVYEACMSLSDDDMEDLHELHNDQDVDISLRVVSPTSNRDRSDPDENSENRNSTPAGALTTSKRAHRFSLLDGILTGVSSKSITTNATQLDSNGQQTEELAVSPATTKQSDVGMRTPLDREPKKHIGTSQRLDAINRNSNAREKSVSVNIKDRTTKPKHRTQTSLSTEIDPSAMGMIKIKPKSHRPSLCDSGDSDDYGSGHDSIEFQNSEGSSTDLESENVNMRPSPPPQRITPPSHIKSSVNRTPHRIVRADSNSDDDNDDDSSQASSSIASLTLSGFIRRRADTDDSDLSFT